MFHNAWFELRWRGFGRICLAASLLIIGANGVVFGADLCTTCIDIKLEHPIVVRGPSPNEPDAPISVIQLPDGTFRGFAANSKTIAIDGKTPLDLGGPAKVVLEPGPAGSPSECGRWLTSLMPLKSRLYGTVHNEGHCEGDTYKSMSVAVSQDNGLTWKDLGQIITGDKSDAPNTDGVGNCTAVDGHDGYWYAYCLRLRDWKNLAARAPHNAPIPGKWKEWDGTGWHEPGLGGMGEPLIPYAGMSAAYWNAAGVVMLLNATGTALQLSISKNKVDFETLPDPLIVYDPTNWKRPAPTALYGYPAMIAEKGLQDISHRFFLAYMYIPPGEDFSQRYLVMQEGQIARSSAPKHPQVRTALARWIGPHQATWTTTGPPISGGHSYTYDYGLGYLMTAAPTDGDGAQLDECFSVQTGIGFLAQAGDCLLEGSMRRRTAGYVYRHHRPDTIALFDCMRRDGARFVSNRLDCENAGTREKSLGFALQ